MPQTFTVLTIDVIGSKAIELQDRKAVQRRFEDCTEYLNNIFQPYLIKKVVINAGDELQGLFKTPQSAFLYFRLFVLLTLPIKVRAGIGCGNWDTISVGNDSFSQDGSAFHFARKAIDSVNDKDRYVLFLSNTDIDQCVNKILRESFNTFTSLSTYNREILLLTELISPIQLDPQHDFVTPSVLDLISKWQSISLYDSGKEKVDFNDIVLQEYLSKSPLVPSDHTSFVVTEGRPKNISSIMGYILNISRQAVEKKYRSCNITEERNNAIILVNLFHERFPG